MNDKERDADRERYRRGLPDHHDPTAGIGGAPPARSALTLRLILANLGFVLAVIFGVFAWTRDFPLVVVIVSGVIALIAAINSAVVTRRKLRGEPG
ncbi:hypothetical protein [Bogoriella caseilytica]|uniref:Uncharacterized protein n=1 Tax=Bogoriella caseilytica TaxID=56055 RepID=A0A3N2BC49_9MICO|nr:hypothetical protein [Bogoriella caseilytica]ROR72772.1 hypothetical protein EDD31_1131 [Bogoriella caseilytica]